MEHTPSKKVLVTLNSHSTGKSIVTGPVTKEPYGYRKHGDKFEVYEADMKVRPDLFKPVGQRPKPMPTVGLRSAGAKPKPSLTDMPSPDMIIEPAQAPTIPPPPVHISPQGREYPVTEREFEKQESLISDDKTIWPLDRLDWSGTSMNKGHIALLSKNGVRNLSDLQHTDEATLLQIDGIGPATIRSLYDQLNKYKSL